MQLETTSSFAATPKSIWDLRSKTDHPRQRSNTTEDHRKDFERLRIRFSDRLSLLPVVGDRHCSFKVNKVGEEIHSREKRIEQSICILLSSRSQCVANCAIAKTRPKAWFQIVNPANGSAHISTALDQPSQSVSLNSGLGRQKDKISPPKTPYRPLPKNVRYVLAGRSSNTLKTTGTNALPAHPQTQLIRILTPGTVT